MLYFWPNALPHSGHWCFFIPVCVTYRFNILRIITCFYPKKRKLGFSGLLPCADLVEMSFWISTDTPDTVCCELRYASFVNAFEVNFYVQRFFHIYRIWRISCRPKRNKILTWVYANFEFDSNSVRNMINFCLHESAYVRPNSLYVLGLYYRLHTSAYSRAMRHGWPMIRWWLQWRHRFRIVNYFRFRRLIHLLHGCIQPHRLNCDQFHDFDVHDFLAPTDWQKELGKRRISSACDGVIDVAVE